MEQERILTLAFKRVDRLHVARSTQRRRNNRLSFTTGKQRRTVNAWQNTHFDFDRTNGFVVTTVDTRLAIDNLLANNRFLDFPKFF